MRTVHWDSTQRVEVFPKKVKVTFLDPGEWRFQHLVSHLKAVVRKEGKSGVDIYTTAELSSSWILTYCTFMDSFSH